MALVKFSALISDVRNKLNGSVFAVNKGGNYFRNKITPVNRQSPFQTAKRSKFGQLSSAFKSLTQDQITAWNEASQNFPYTNPFGDQKTLSGHQLFVQLNNNLAQGNVNPLTQPPLPSGTKPFTLTSVDIDTSASTIAIANSIADLNDDDIVILEGTTSLSPGVRFAKNSFRQFLATRSLIYQTKTAADLYSAYVGRLGLPIVGSSVFIRMKVINGETGETSTYQSVQATIS